MTSIGTISTQDCNSNGNQITRNITWESSSRVLTSTVHALLAGVITHVQNNISFGCIKISMILVIICLIASILIMPIRAFSVPHNLRLFQVLIVSDVIITIFLLFIAIAFSSRIHFIHQLKGIGVISDSLHHLCLAVVVMSWVSIFFYTTVILGLFLIYRKSFSSCNNQKTSAEKYEETSEDE